MTELAVRTHHPAAVDIPTSHDQTVARLIEWARAADAAYEIAVRLCATKFAPAAYRGKPDEGTAAILAGAEVGLSPTASLRAFDDIQGTPAPKAITLRAILQGLGHDVRVEESSPTRAVVSGLRAGDPESKRQTSTWTIERATTAGYVAKNPNYKTKAAEMLVARATAEACRWTASDAIMGMPYSSEEIRDEGPSFEARPVAPRVTAAEILGTANIVTEPTPAVSATPVTDIVASAVADNTVGMCTRKQQNEMFALWADLGYGGDENRVQRLESTAKILGLPTPPESSNDLTETEAAKVIAAQRERKAAIARNAAQDGGGES